MKRWKIAGIVSALIVSSALITGCGSGVTQEQYDSLAVELETSEANLESVQADLESVQAELESVQAEYDEYRESMQEYEGLSTDEAQAREIEAQEAIRESEEAAAKAESEATAAAEAEAKAGYDTGITYDQLARTPDDYEGKKVKFTGEVLQVVEGDDETDLRIAVDGDYDMVIYCGYSPDTVSSRVLEDDEITIYGTSVGLITYESTLGGDITIPAIWVDKIDQ